MSVLTLHKTHLKNRTQTTLFDDFYSDTRAINDGVPQGSVLGPTLFLCYINDIVGLGFEGGVGLYANDMVIYVSGSLESALTLNKNEQKPRQTEQLGHREQTHHK